MPPVRDADPTRLLALPVDGIQNVSGRSRNHRKPHEKADPSYEVVGLLVVCPYAQEKATDLGVGGSNPSGRAKFFRRSRSLAPRLDVLAGSRGCHFTSQIDPGNPALLGRASMPTAFRRAPIQPSDLGPALPAGSCIRRSERAR